LRLPRSDFSGSATALALLGLPPWGIPLPVPRATTTAYVALSACAGNRAGRPGAKKPQATVIRNGLSSQALQERTRTGYCSLCFRVSKSAGSWP